ncbi:phosphonate ABC transporter ATP-binding protein [Salisediminibacterium halotolerans]|uniref:phosphonate ABC transporter ATP-binding protein n=1 Tax=Salisediminibacterium halotolerans TaxID=517425 RepID=UPI000EB5CA7D|nr:phosphonate ABC transporter ATP-binding protein [Salisediminibacterium halotolerans]RLJ73137.1 phosphonate transport system ATP-binding protein [Actinophytocola xinjiangensis]RPE86559.1 phosphonate transport system ATP-binding protein [Salisediminibacterium halotolerans]TWG33934.1 phosphonate transport system ATP-binding protein [Salisediminibacterium halotolerans]GEL08850.1 phosphonates import ATP-binding protein PhnC [Salisediminibacterium halotolerans]
MLDLQNVFVKYQPGDLPALNDVTFQAERGEFICVLGRSGAGKSTLVRTINGLQQPSSGTVTVLGKKVAALSSKEQRLLRADIGMIFQHFQLIPRLTARQNIYTGMFGRRPSWKNLTGIFATADHRRASEAIESVGLTGFEQRRAENLSGGQKQRVGIARALVQNPLMLLGDEPFASLDPTTSNEIFQLLADLHEQQDWLTIANVHNIELAKKFASRIIGMKDGKIVFDGSPAEMTEAELEAIYASK